MSEAPFNYILWQLGILGKVFVTPSPNINGERDVITLLGLQHLPFLLNLMMLFQRLLERTRHWKHSETRVMVVGGRPEIKDVLLHYSFRNTVHALYLAVNPELLNPLERNNPYLKQSKKGFSYELFYREKNCASEISP